MVSGALDLAEWPDNLAVEPVLTGRNGDGERGIFFRFLPVGDETPDERPTRSGSMTPASYCRWGGRS
ncbi:MAG: hypothetical protein EBU49_00080 [Proteobacteria bacterium]|nr:hypothetical protein [Pseudomonadota bacterium]